MSRLASKPIQLPSGVELNVAADKAAIKGPKGQIDVPVYPGVTVAVEGNEVAFSLDPKGKATNAFLGLTFALVSNGIQGVSKGFEKKLTMIGVGYRAAVKGNSLDLQLGFSHPNVLDIPEGLQVKVENSTDITVSGVNKQQVGQFAANIRSIRPPEPYKGKGVRYVDEYVRRKAGKAAKGK